MKCVGYKYTEVAYVDLEPRDAFQGWVCRLRDDCGKGKRGAQKEVGAAEWGSWIKGGEVQTGWAAKMAIFLGVAWALTREGQVELGWGCLLPAGWLAPSPRAALARGTALAGSRREAQERERAACPPACRGV